MSISQFLKSLKNPSPIIFLEIFFKLLYYIQVNNCFNFTHNKQKQTKISWIQAFNFLFLKLFFVDLQFVFSDEILVKLIFICFSSFSPFLFPIFQNIHIYKHFDLNHNIISGYNFVIFSNKSNDHKHTLERRIMIIQIKLFHLF